jgi:hypothetical protein
VNIVKKFDYFFYQIINFFLNQLKYFLIKFKNILDNKKVDFKTSKNKIRIISINLKLSIFLKIKNNFKKIKIMTHTKNVC